MLRLRPADARKLVPKWARAALAHPRVARTVLLLRRTVREFREDHCSQLAAAVSYHLFFSLFPLAIVLIGILGLFTHSARTRESVLSELLSVLPLATRGQDQVRSLLNSVSGGAGALGLVGILGLLWAASGVMAAVRTAVNVAWDVAQRRPFLRGKAVDLLLVACTFVMLAVTFGLVLLTSLARNSTENLPTVLEVFAGPAALLFTVVVTLGLLAATFGGLYWFLPAVHVRARDAFLGGLVAAVGVGALQLGFSVYLSNFSHYNRVYGSLGAIVAFLFFVYVAAAVFLFGAELASEYPRLPDRDPAVEKR